MKIAFITHKTNNLIKARGKLIEDIIKRGHKVFVICPKEDMDEKKEEKLKKMGVTYKTMFFHRTSVGLLNNIKILKNLVKILKEEKPDMVFSYTIKPIIFGSIAARIAKVDKIYSLITGMGYNYSKNTIRIRFIRVFCNIGYRIALPFNTKVIFQNKEDKEELTKKGYIKETQAEIIDGSGVNMEIFKKAPLPKEEFIVLMISRMLDVKGVIEFCEAAEIVKKKYTHIRFIHIGEEDNTYRGVPARILQPYIEKDIVEFHGRKNNVAEYIANSTVVVLPSYLREGIPRVLIESLAVGRPIITTNIRGCKETVKEGINGFLIPIKNSKILADKLTYMIEHQEILPQMAEESYKYAKERFELSKINKKMIEIMDL